MEASTILALIFFGVLLGAIIGLLAYKNKQRRLRKNIEKIIKSQDKRILGGENIEAFKIHSHLSEGVDLPKSEEGVNMHLKPVLGPTSSQDLFEENRKMA